MEKIRVRFAPSPTGHLHIGGARTALYNWLIARQKKGRFILRIEDTDVERSTEESIRAILEGMKWFGLDWDEGPEKGGDHGPYLQSQRKELYAEAINKLLDEKKAYQCFCTPSELDAKKEKARTNKGQYAYDGTCRDLPKEKLTSSLEDGKPYVIRLKKREDKEIVFKDLIKGEIRIHSDTIDDFIIRRSDGNVVYNFAVVCDDALMKIDHVIRGDDHISNTPKQILLYEALGYDTPFFAHVPMILGEDKTRLSKRHGATSISQYRDDGFLPEALRNYLARLGWGYDDSQEIFSTDDLIKKFSIEKVSKNPAVFNYKKLEWLNGVYIQNLSLEARTEAVIPYLKEAGLIDDKFIRDNPDLLKEIVAVVGDRMKTLKDIVPYSDYFFMEKVQFDEDVKEKIFQKADLADAYQLIAKELEKVKTWDKENIEKELQAISDEVPIKRKDFFQAIRAALTGRLFSPDLTGMMVIMGKEKVLTRITNALNACTKDK